MGGTAVLLEVIRMFGDLQNVGWRPLRTIEFASCKCTVDVVEQDSHSAGDGEEYNLIGYVDMSILNEFLVFPISYGPMTDDVFQDPRNMSRNIWTRSAEMRSHTSTWM